MHSPPQVTRACVCGTRLARDNLGPRCGPCERHRRDRPGAPPRVPASFWDDPELRAALAGRHMGRVIRAFRTHPHHGRQHLTQTTASTWAGITQAQLSRIENGPPVLHLDRLTEWARILRIPASLLWFQLSSQPVTMTTEAAGSVVEITLDLDSDIDPDGWSTLTYRHRLLNLTGQPVTRIARELWFETARAPLALTPDQPADNPQHVAVQRIHDTANLSKFACLLSPPLPHGATAEIAYRCQGGRFVRQHYWRQSIQRPVRELRIHLRHRGSDRLVSCNATEEHVTGAERSAVEGLSWDTTSPEEVRVRLHRQNLVAGQAVTLRWEVARASG